MKPDPIRQAFEDYVRKVGLRDERRYCSSVDFTAGAKWAARALYERIQREIDLSVVIAPTALHEISKHFGVEGEA